jgi:hypothetical protein
MDRIQTIDEPVECDGDQPLDRLSRTGEAILSACRNHSHAFRVDNASRTARFVASQIQPRAHVRASCQLHSLGSYRARYLGPDLCLFVSI